TRCYRDWSSDVCSSDLFEAGLDAAGAFEERGFRGFEQLRGTREQGFARAQKLEFVAQSFLRARPGKFRGLKFAGGEIHEREAQRDRKSVVEGKREGRSD